MALVTNSNFEANFPEVEALIKKATFIAVDSEFTGLFATNDSKPSLFDSPEVRYGKLRVAATNFIICQFGLVPFIWDKAENRYLGYRFVFYICPRSCVSANPTFAFQSSAVEFLCSHNFDFNKFAYEGIPYLSKNDEDELRKAYSENPTLWSTYSREIVDEDLWRKKLSAVSTWLAKAAEGETYIIEKEGFTDFQSFLFLRKLRQNFASIWASCADNNKLLIEKVSPEKRKELEEKSSDEDRQLVDVVVGFSRLFQVLVNSKKPIVGHNVLMDLLLMFQQFHRPLPEHFWKFKSELHELFPVVYDTKCIFLQNKRLLEEKSCNGSGKLSDLFDFFKSPEGQYVALFYPSIRDITRTAVKEGYFHEAGYDAYAAGFVFLRLLHVLASQERTLSEARPFTWKELENVASPYRNKVNLIRAMTHYINLNGNDPPCVRPQWLYVTTKDGKPLNHAELTQELARLGTVDVKVLSYKEALIAVGNKWCVQDILRLYHDGDKNLEVMRYSVVRHYKPLRRGLWLSFFLTGGLTLYLLWKIRSS